MKCFARIALLLFAIVVGTRGQTVDAIRQVKNLSYIDLRSVGAVSGNGTDYHTVIQGAINSAVNTGKYVYCNGEYSVGTVGLTVNTATSGNIQSFTWIAGPGGCRLNYSGTGYAISFGSLSAGTANYTMSGTIIALYNVAGKGIAQLAADRVNLVNVRVDAAGSYITSGICHLIDSGTLDSIFTQTTDFSCSQVLIGQRIQSTGSVSGNLVTTVINLNMKVTGPGAGPVAGSIGLDILDGNGDGITMISGNLEHLNHGVKIYGVTGKAAHGVLINLVRFEDNTSDITADPATYLNTFKDNINLVTLNYTPDGVVSGNHTENTLVNNTSATLSVQHPNWMLGDVVLKWGNLYVNGRGVAPAIKAIVPNASTQNLIEFVTVSGSLTPFKVDYLGCISHSFINQICTTSTPPEGNRVGIPGDAHLYSAGSYGTIVSFKENGLGNTGWSRPLMYNLANNNIYLPQITSGTTNILNISGTSGSTGSFRFCSGGCSSAFGGGWQTFQQAHASKPGYVSANIGATVGKFTVNNDGAGVGTDVFLIDAIGVEQSIGLAFANLPAAVAGKRIWCTNCAITNPCTGAGTGAWAFGVAGPAWRCPF